MYDSFTYSSAAQEKSALDRIAKSFDRFIMVYQSIWDYPVTFAET